MEKEVTMKPCSLCRVLKSFDEFYHQGERRDGRSSWCRACVCNAKRTGNSRYFRRACGCRIDKKLSDLVDLCPLHIETVLNKGLDTVKKELFLEAI